MLGSSRLGAVKAVSHAIKLKPSELVQVCMLRVALLRISTAGMCNRLDVCLAR